MAGAIYEVLPSGSTTPDAEASGGATSPGMCEGQWVAALFAEVKNRASDPLGDEPLHKCPVRNRGWRIAEQLREAVWEFTDQSYESEVEANTLPNLEKKGDQLVAKCGGDIRNASCQVQKGRLGTGDP